MSVQSTTRNSASIQNRTGRSIRLNSSSTGKDGAKNGTIELSALKSVALTSETEDISMSADAKNITLNAKSAISSDSDTIGIKSRTSSLHADENITIEGDEMRMDGGSSIRISSGDTDVI